MKGVDEEALMGVGINNVIGLINREDISIVEEVSMTMRYQ